MSDEQQNSADSRDRPEHFAQLRDADSSLGRSLALVRFLRGACPWDAKQTPSTLRPYLIEEAHEVADAIRNDAELIAPAIEGIHSVELANAALLSAWEGKTIDLPMDAERYESILTDKGESSTFQKKQIDAASVASADDFAKSNKT